MQSARPYPAGGTGQSPSSKQRAEQKHSALLVNASDVPIAFLGQVGVS
jgi:hypothetical protein